MSISKKLLFEDYDNFLTEEDYTTSAEAQDYFRNMDEMVTALIDIGLWQPSTRYAKGAVVKSPSMPSGTEAICVAENGGTSSSVEPSWGEVGGDNVSDGTCFWQLRYTGTVVSVNGAKPDKEGNVSVPIMQGATSNANGVEGLVPAPMAGEQGFFLRGDGTYAKAGSVDSVNGQTGDVVVGKIVDATISGKVITLTFADGTTKTLTTQDTVTSNAISASSVGDSSGYTKLSNNMTMQYGTVTTTAVATTVTLPKAMANATYSVVTTQCNSKSWEQNMKVTARTTTSFTVNTLANMSDKITWVVVGKGA